MGMVIRVLYNTQGWQSPCKHPGMDSLCWKCFQKNNLDIVRPSKNDEVCSGLCWERDLCSNYEWGCTPKGRRFGNRARKGEKVFFVFQQPDHKYTLWGTTKVDSVNVPPIRQLAGREIGYDYWIHFDPIEALPRDKWVEDLTDIDLVGEPWKMNRYRFITAAEEAELEKRIRGIVPKKPADTLSRQATRLVDLVSYQEGAVVSRTVIDKKTGTVTLFAFGEGQGLSEHTAPFDALVYVLDGEAEVTVSAKPIHLNAGEMVIMPANEPHALRGIRPFKMMLVMMRS